MAGGAAALGAATLLAVAAGASTAQPARVDFAPCASCHGEGGVSYNADTPSLAGQTSSYASTQLFLFRAGRRRSALMSEVTAPMSDADLHAFSELIGRLPAAPPGAPAPADPARMKRGTALAERYRCSSCHGEDFAGAQEVPRLAGQREDYLARSLAEFRAGTRIGYTPAMNEALVGLGPAELDDLAHYVAHRPGAAAAALPAASAPR